MARPSPFFWNLIARKYARDAIADMASYERKLAQTRAHLKPDWHVLEVGCGTGSTALLHAPHVARYVATDFSEKMLAIARQKAAEQDGPVPEFHLAPLHDLPGTNRPYDAVLAMSVLHLVPDLDDALAQIRAQLAPGGLFVSSNVCIGDMSGLLPWIMPRLGWTRLLPLVNPFTMDFLLDAMARAGFEVEDHWRPGPGRAAFVVARAV